MWGPEQFAVFKVFLKDARTARGFTQAQMARECGVNEATYASWERKADARPPRLHNLIALADYLGVSVDTMLGRTPNQNRPFAENGIRWRLDWGHSNEHRVLGAEVWHELVRGRRLADLAMQRRQNPRMLERFVQDLVIEARIVVEEVPRVKALEDRLDERFRSGDRPLLQDVRVARLGHIDWNVAMIRYVLLGHLGKLHLLEETEYARTIGLCGGFAVASLVRSIHRGECPNGIKVVPITTTPVFESAGTSANANVSALAFRHADYAVEASELPFLFDRAGNEDHSEPAQVARKILEEAANVDIVYMGIGSRASGALKNNPGDVRSRYLATAGIDIPAVKQREQPIGNILYYVVGTNGEPVPDFKEQNEQLICSIGLDGLRRLVAANKQVVVIAAGKDKADVTRAAIRSGYVNTLIIDDELAQAMLASEPSPELVPAAAAV